MKKHFDNIQAVLKKNAEARQAHKQALAILESQKGTYAPDYIEKKAKELQASMRETNQQTYEQFRGMLHDLALAAIDKHSQWPNMADPKLSNALKIIELVGKKLDGETVRKINEQFSGDIPSLKALRQIYKAQGVSYDGGISKMLYDPELAEDNLSQWAYGTFFQDGSLNQLANQISKIAQKEGITDFPEVVDQAGLDSAYRASAGLAAK